MFGRHFESMYTGSMIGSGSVVFAVWGYVISHMRPPAFEVELNPKLLAFILGDPEEQIEKAIEVLCSPDARSRSKSEDGRRLVRRGEYLYHVVNGETYNALRNDADKKAYWRDQKKRQRMAARARENGQASPSEEQPKDNPPKPAPAEIHVPSSLSSSPKFLELWTIWNEHLIEKGKRPTEKATRMQIEKLAAMGVERAIAALKNSVTNNYQGIFESNENKPSNHPSKPLQHSQPNNGF